jgi:hypothetical protein
MDINRHSAETTMLRVFTFLCFLGLSVATVAMADTPALDPAEEAAIRSEIGQLFDQLDSDTFETRRRAAGRVEQLMARAELQPLLAMEFQQAVLTLDISFEVRWQLERWAKRLPKAFIEPPDNVSGVEITRLIAKLDDDSYAVRLGATRRIEWLLMRDEHVLPVRRALESRLADRSIAEALGEVKKLMNMTRPAMVAEYWQAGHCKGQQHLLIGVPSQGPGAPSPSHFDRIDDETAHCVSGVNLSPGDYPVGIAIAHPKDMGALFHLVNLPTPRQRIEYDRIAKTDDADRLASLSRRTFDRMLRQKHELSPRELTMLVQLDASEVSRFAGKYFLAVSDKVLPAESRRLSVGHPSLFGVICARLAVIGTRDAMPGLLDAIDRQRFLPPSSRSRYRLHWLAALSIAQRDPWPDADTWLAARIGDRESLIEGHLNAPELGATAAGLLLKHHGQNPSQYGLRSAPEAVLMRMRIDGYRFELPGGRARVEQWWKEKQKDS